MINSVEDVVDRVALRRVMTTLPAREERVLRMRFGYDGAPCTLREIGEEFGISGNRVRQIEFKALNRLRRRFEGRRPALGLATTIQSHAPLPTTQPTPQPRGPSEEEIEESRSSNALFLHQREQLILFAMSYRGLSREAAESLVGPI